MISNKDGGVIDIIIGLIVIIAVSVIFFNWNSNKQDMNKANSYLLLANFSDISGILEGSKVKISGIAIGQVCDCTLNKEDYSATVAIKINKDIKISSDAVATISSDGIIDQKYIKIIPSQIDGNNILKEGDYIKYTQPPLTLESLVEYLKP